MKLKHIVPLGVSLVVLGISACSSSRSIGGGGRYCSANQDSIFALPSTAEKLSLKPADQKIKEGSYVYDKAEMLYVYKPSTDNRTWVIIQAVENTNVELDKAGTKGNSAGVYCVRGLTPSTPAFSFSAVGVSSMKSLPNKTVLVESRTYTFNWDPTDFKVTVSVEPNTTALGSPEEIYTDKAKDLSFYKVVRNNDADHRYDITSVEEYPKEKLTVYLRTKFVRKDLTAAEKALVVEEPAPAVEGEATIIETGDEPTPSEEVI